MHIAYTSINLNYLGRALTLAKSVKENSPEVYLVAVICEPFIDLKAQDNYRSIVNCIAGFFDEFITLEDFPLSVHQKLRRMSVIEMCTAIKAEAALKLLGKHEVDYVTYLDPDLYFFDSLESIRLEHQFGEVLLTPHIVNPPVSNESIWNNEIYGSIKHGVYNLGFISFTNTAGAKAVAQWWADRLAIYSGTDYQYGLFTDQKWFDLAPGYFPQIHIVRKVGWNVAPWNLEERITSISLEAQPASENSLLFFHFTKYPFDAFWNSIKSVKNYQHFDNVFETYEISFESIEEYLAGFRQTLQIEPKSVETGIRSKPAYFSYRIKESVKAKLRCVIDRLARIQSLRDLSNSRIIFRKFVEILIVATKQSPSQSSTFSEPRSIEIPKTLDVLLISHPGGGGVGDYLENRFLEHLRNEKDVGTLTPSQNKFLLRTRDGSTHLNLDQARELILNCQSLEIHHLYKNENLKLHDFKLPKYSIFLHDKYFLTTRPFSDSLQIRELESKQPGVNISLNPAYPENREMWFMNGVSLLQKAHEIYAPSRYMRDYYLTGSPELQIEIVSWEPSEYFNEAPRTRSAVINRKILVVIGTMIPQKGSNDVDRLAKKLYSYDPSICIYVFGELTKHSENLANNPNVSILNNVKRERIDSFLHSRYENVVGWIPSITGESYSFALSHFLKNNIPIICTNLGALPERTFFYQNTLLYDPTEGDEDLVVKFINFLKTT